MSRDYDFDGDDYPTAVAAASYAIWSSLDKPKPMDQNANGHNPRTPQNKTRRKAQKKAEIPPQQPRKNALNFSDKTSKQSFKDPGDIKVPDIDKTSSNHIHMSLGRPSTFPDMHMNGENRQIPETPPETPYGLSTPQQFETTTKPGPRDSMADAWEKEEMASIQERYERLRSTIDKWETKKKMKVHLKGNEMRRIEEIAGEARAQADRKRIKEEMRVKEKANKIRLTGKLPATCLCF